MSADLVFFGLGIMGGRSAALAVKEGLRVVGFDPDESARDSARQAGVQVADEGDAAVAEATTILLSVPRPEHVAELATGALAHAQAGSVVIDLSTIDPATARQAATTLATHDITYVDAPVLGRPDRCGAWTLVVGGAQRTVELVTPVLEKTIASRVLRVGDVGAGSVVKLLNNLMFGAINAVTAEALTLCEHQGVDPAAFVNAVSSSGAATVSNLFKEAAPRMITGDDEPRFALDLLTKDNRLARRLAEGSGVSAPVAAVVDEINNFAADQGLGKRDSGVIHQVYDGLSPQRQA